MALNPADLSVVSRLLDDALALPAAERAAWLDTLAAEHRVHRDTLREMLEQAAGLDTDERLSTLPRLGGDGSVARNGDRVGPYRLLHEIGRGGMGSVWLAERADGAYQRQVALKLPRLAWGAGLAERMARERDIGALLEHPHIARLYDAGVDERGRPYLALQFVDGQPIDAWCKARALSVHGRLQLFVQVARAVAYAHGRLVVHRDLKPSNVLVSADGRAHLLDFGIAKLLHEAGADEPGLTQAQGRVLTPHYASPEQVTGEPITVQSDVYSLGVLLYELLTGTLPLAPRRGSLGAIEDAILQGDAPPASSRAAERVTARALRGEVDAILAKAMHREPALRYATADALAQDIERHLAGETVAARPDSLGYRLRKTVRRHWLGVSAAAAVVLAVLAGSGVALVQAQRAERSAERARVVKEFVVSVFRVNARGSPANQDLRQLPVELLIERGAALIDKSFAGQPDLQAELYGVISNIFVDMGANQLALDYATRHARLLALLKAAPVEQAAAALLLGDAMVGAGRLDAAREQSAIASSLSGGWPSGRARAELLLARVHVDQARFNEGLQALDRFDRDFGRLSEVLASQGTLLRARALVRTDRFGEALPLYRSAIEQALRAEGALSPIAIDARIDLANNLIARNRLDEGKVALAAALSALRASGGPGDIRAAREESHFYAGLFLMELTSFEDARAGIERSRASVAARGTLVPEAVKAALDLDLGEVLLDAGDIEKGAPLVATSAAVLNQHEQSVASRFETAAFQGTAAMYTAQHDLAETMLRQRLDLQRQGGRQEHPMTAYDHAFLALNAIMQGRFGDADATLQAAPDFASVARAKGWKLKAGHSAPFAVVRRLQVRSRLEAGDIKGALALQLPEETDSDRKFPLDDYVLRGALLCASGKLGPGLVMLEEQVAWHARTDYPAHPDLARTRALAGLCALASGRRQRARELAAEADRALQSQPSVSPYFRAPLIQLKRRLGVDTVAAARVSK